MFLKSHINIKNNKTQKNNYKKKILILLKYNCNVYRLPSKKEKRRINKNISKLN